MCVSDRSTYTFEVACSRCGSNLVHENGVVRAGSESLAVARCDRCKVTYCISVHLRAFRVDTPAGERKAAQRARERVA